MIRLAVLAGLALMFTLMHMDGNLNKYINMRYSYLSIIAIVLLIILFFFEFLRQYLLERKQMNEAAAAHCSCGNDDHGHDHHEHDHHDHHGHEHHGHDHEHGGKTKLSRAITYLILFVPVVTGIFLPIQTLDSSFVKAKGFSFPEIDVTADNPGFHQFLKPDMSVYYGKEGYAAVSKKELGEIQDLSQVHLTDDNYLKSLESIYNYPNLFVDRTISFDGFVYKGDQADANHAFVFRFGFIHCVADSGVFGMLVEFPSGVQLKDDLWVHVSGKMTLEFYQPFKQTIPKLTVESWNTIEAPKDPYVYRTQ